MLINQKRQQSDGLLMRLSQSINEDIFKCQQSSELQLTTK